MNSYILHNRARASLVPVCTDASSDFEEEISCIGIVIDQGSTSKKIRQRIKFNANIAVCEAEAVLIALRLCKDLPGMVISTDCETLYRSIVTPTGKEPSDLKKIIKSIRKECKSYSKVVIQLVGRFLTEDAHREALYCLRKIRGW